METELKELYRELGFTGRLEDAHLLASPGALLSGSFAEELASGAVVDGFIAKALSRVLEEDPDGLVAIVRKTVKQDVSANDLRAAVGQITQALRDPAPFAAQLRATRAAREAAFPPPDGIPVYDGITVSPGEQRYEVRGDLLGWVANCGGYWLLQKAHLLKRARRPVHAATSRFVYPMRLRNGDLVGKNDTISVALFSDFATGTYGSRYVAKAIEILHPTYAIHLGDVYYAGTWGEVDAHLRRPLEPLFPTSRVFALNGNHEMLSGGFAYFDFIARKRGEYPGMQEQESSYFCLRGPYHQIVAIDTAYDYANDGRHLAPELGEWLHDRLCEGYDADLKNILLSQHEPFGLGDVEARPLLEDVRKYARDAKGKWLVDLWFWGDEHYCALFDPSDDAPFVASCIGHGGFPVDIADVQRRESAARLNGAFGKMKWVDASPRFPTIRENELGNTGFCVMQLGPDGVSPTYRNWLDQELQSLSFAA